MGIDRSTAAWSVGAAIATGLIAAIPLLLVTYPPLQDLPNHLARIAVLAAPAGDPLLDHYAVRWAPLPNLATDLILLALSQVMPLALAAKLLLGLSGTLWLGGPILLHWAVYRRASIVPLLGAVFLLNRTLQMGFLNFHFGTGLLACCFAVWVLLTGRPLVVRVVAGAAMAVVLFFSHLFAVAVFAVAVTLWECLAPAAPARPRLTSRLALLVAMFLPTLAIFLASPHVAAGELYAYPNFNGVLGFLVTKADLIARFASPDGVVGILAVLLLVVVLVGSGRTPPFDRRLGTIVLALLLLFLALPSRLLSGSHADWRILAPLALFATAWPPLRLERRHAAAYALAIIAFVAGITFDQYRRWKSAEANYQAVHALIAQIPRGSTLAYLTVGFGSVKRGEDPSFLHYGSYATVERDVVVPSLFAFPTQQPIAVRPEFAKLSDQLVKAHVDRQSDVDWSAVADFDYAILALAKPLPRRPGLEEIAVASPFHLYRVNR